MKIFLVNTEMLGWIYTKSCETLDDNFQWTLSTLSLQQSRAHAMEVVYNDQQYIIGGVGQLSLEKISGTTTIETGTDKGFQ